MGVVALANAFAAASALAINGVAAWGTNSFNSLDVGWEGTNEPAPQPTRTDLSGATKVVGGWHTSFAIMPDGTVKAFGSDNEFVELGDGTNEPKTTAVTVHKLEHVVDVASSGYHALALSESGGVSTVWAWGDGISGQDGNGKSGIEAMSSEPVEVPVPGHVIAIAAGGGADFAISDMEGTNVVWSWGSDENKVLGIAEEPPKCLGPYEFRCKTTPVRVEFPALGAGFKVVEISGGVAGSQEVKSIYARAENSVTLEDHIYAWGTNKHGSLGNGGTTDSAVPTEVDIAVGQEEAEEELHLGGPDPVVALAGGPAYGLGLLKDGHVIGWGNDRVAQLGPSKSKACMAKGERCECKKIAWSCDQLPQLVSGVESVEELVAGDGFNLARTKEGRIYSWGSNTSYGQLGLGIEDGPERCYEEPELKEPEEMEIGYCERTPTPIPTLEHVSDIGASFTGGLAILPEEDLPAPAMTVTPEHNKLAVKWTAEIPPEGKYYVSWAPIDPETGKAGAPVGKAEPTGACSPASPCEERTGDLEYRPYEVVVKTLEKVAPGTEIGSYQYLTARRMIVTPLTPVLEVSGVSPTSGPEAGGNVITINGDNFEAGATVTVGGNAATSVEVLSPLEIKATVPGVTTGGTTVDVRVSETAGESALTPADHYTYMAAPQVMKLEPDSAAASGGQVITMSGRHMEGITKVMFGPAEGEIVAGSNTASEVKARPPAMTVGTYHVVVTTPGGTNAEGGGNVFKALPSVTSVTPNEGPKSGGTKIEVVGYGLSEATFKIGGTKVKSVSCSPGGTHCEMLTPAHAVGFYNVVASVGPLSSLAFEADLFTFVE